MIIFLDPDTGELVKIPENYPDVNKYITNQDIKNRANALARSIYMIKKVDHE